MRPVVIIGTTGALYCLITYLIGFLIAKLLLRNTDWYTNVRSGLCTKGHASIDGFMISSGGSGGSSSSGFSVSGRVIGWRRRFG